MDSKGIFRGSIPLLSKALDLRSQKHRLMVSNIANVDTPDYKAFDLHVDEAMQKISERANKVSLHNTHPGHLSARPNHNQILKPQLQKSDSISLRGDGNTVDIDQSMADLAENSIMYNTATQIIKKKFEGLKLAIKGGK